MIAMIRLLDLAVVVWNLLKNQKNQKIKKCLSPKNHKNMGIYPQR